MNRISRWVRLFAVTGIVAFIAVFFLTLSVTATEAACNPCVCENDRRLNCLGGESYAVYTRINEAGRCNIDIFTIDGSGGRRVIRVTTAEQNALPALPTRNLIIENYYQVAIYKLTTGEYQVNYGANPEGKSFSLRFVGCPGSNVEENVF